MSIIDQLKIYKKDIYLGILERTSQGCRLILDEKFRQSHSHISFQIRADKAIIEYIGVGLPPYFAGLLPEGIRLSSLVRRLKMSTDDLFSILAESGGDTIGDIHFKELESAKEWTELPTDFELFKKQLRMGHDPGQSALAGVQEKLSAARISLPMSLKNKNKSYLLKLSSSEFPDLINNENTCLEIAKNCGLSVNKAQKIQDQNNQEALLVERFDREWNTQEKKWLRFHQEDACQFLNRYPADKYNLSFKDVAEGLVRFSTTPEIEILNLLQLKAFSYLIGNGDLHAKNISLLQRTDKDFCGLSPAYDILSTAIYGDQKMALLFLGKNQNLKKKTFIDFGLHFGVPVKATENMLHELVKKFDKNKDKIFSVPLALTKKKFLTSFFAERMKHLI